ncbi:MAG: MBL fold metallo-hydrolase [Syntrophomonadaceae bacterium]|jgi:glyoxylase-like metal-dependent hydrolase (beta-lactamase superfamily II)|nr:MBL fold metallo-hydrolase [Syntrophomonadaceae bacterium]
MSFSVIGGINGLTKIGDIYMIKTVMPFPLRENNCFLAESEDGWCVIDTGVNIQQNKEIWQKALKYLGISFKHIKNILLTHYHHDHMGLAGWMQELSGAKVLLPKEDIITFTTYITGNYYEEVRQDCFQAGWSDMLTHDLVADVHSIEILVRPFPEITELPDNYTFDFGGTTFTCLPLPGHTDGHVVLYSRQKRLLLSGDNIVPHTILHLTDWPHTRLTDPLNTHLAGLDVLSGFPVVSIIPGHGDVFNNLEERIGIIKKHHMRRKEVVYAGIKDGFTAWDLTAALFKESNYIHIKRLLLAETLAYLEALNEEGLVKKDICGNSFVYKRISTDLNFNFMDKLAVSNPS